jgi:5-methylcytosine-specific restriction endonuclease McrA
MMTRTFLACILVLVPLCAQADYLEVRRNAFVYEDPSRHSEPLYHIELEEGEGPYLLKLVGDERVNGYYRVRLRGDNREGWIYKTLVRRYGGMHPAYTAYRRSLYRHWIDADGDCQNTRAEVLIRDDDDGDVSFRSGGKCIVESGTWVDPYTGTTFRNARQLDVDHVVPLKNAHESGAWAWSRERRKQYANSLDDRNHLLAVSASENRRKGAKGPDQYLPPRAAFHCDYVRVWVAIKKEWELEMTDAEGRAVQAVLDRCP